MFGNYVLAIVLGAAIGIYAGKGYQSQSDQNIITGYQTTQCKKADRALTVPGS